MRLRRQLEAVALKWAESRGIASESTPTNLVLPDDAIAAEGDVFRTHAGVLAIDPEGLAALLELTGAVSVAGRARGVEPIPRRLP